MTAIDDNALLRLKGVKKYFPILNAWNRRTGWLKALDDVTLSVHKGEILGIVGESGCGKSTLGKTVMGIHPPSAGKIIFEGNNIADARIVCGGVECVPRRFTAVERAIRGNPQNDGSQYDQPNRGDAVVFASIPF